MRYEYRPARVPHLDSERRARYDADLLQVTRKCAIAPEEARQLAEALRN